MSTSDISEMNSTNDTSFSSVLLKKKLSMLENSSTTSIIHDTIQSSVTLIKPSSTSSTINEHEPMKSSSRRRKPLRPWSLSARVERPNTAIHINNNATESISDNDADDNHLLENKHSPMSNGTINSNLDEDNHSSNQSWPRQLSTIEEILKLYHVETDETVQCIRCGCYANQDNLLDHISIHYPHICYTCGFYCDSSSILDEHNQTHTSNNLVKSTIVEEMPLTRSVPIKSSDSTNVNSNSEKTTPSNKAKIHRCRQCSYVSNVKEEYWAHHRVHIRADKILECPSCPFVTEYKHHLEYHLRNHLGSKPFKCSKCEYACVNLSMLRSHKKSHFRHLLFKCLNCSFESKQYHLIQEHLQIESHQLYLDDNIEEFLKEYSSGNLTSLNTTMNNSNPPSLTPLPTIQKTNTRLSTSKKRKTISSTTRIKRKLSTSSIDSSLDMISPLSTDEHPIESLQQPSMPFNQSLLASIGQFNATPGQFNDFLVPYQQFLTQQIQSHLSSTMSSSSSLHLDSNNNPTSLPTFITAGYSLLSSCLKTETNDNISSLTKRQRKDNDDENEQRNVVDQQTQVDEWQIKRLFECFHCEMIFKDFAMYCTHKQFHYSSDNPFRCAQCGEQTTNKYDFFVHVTQQAHELT